VPRASFVARAFVATGVGALACEPRERVPADAPAPGPASAAAVELVEPAEADTVSMPLTVRLLAVGVEVVPASGIREPGRGHHHLILDHELPALDSAVPAGPGHIHLGSGAAFHVFDSLSPGPHRVIAVFAFGDHVPMPAVRQDTVRFVVR
jgi:hypothetical protein